MQWKTNALSIQRQTMSNSEHEKEKTLNWWTWHLFPVKAQHQEKQWYSMRFTLATLRSDSGDDARMTDTEPAPILRDPFSIRRINYLLFDEWRIPSGDDDVLVMSFNGRRCTRDGVDDGGKCTESRSTATLHTPINWMNGDGRKAWTNVCYCQWTTARSRQSMNSCL